MGLIIYSPMIQCSDAADAYRQGLQYEQTNQGIKKALSSVEEILSKLPIPYMQLNCTLYLHGLVTLKALAAGVCIMLSLMRNPWI